jgi:hypothetical protein
MALANVSLTNTFDEWRIRTNQIIMNIAEIEGNVANTIRFTGGYITGNLSVTENVYTQDLVVTGNAYFTGGDTRIVNLL